MTMPNTNPSDLDRAARALEIKLMEFCTFMEDDLETARFDGIVVPALNQLRAALCASGVPEAEAVAIIGSAFVDGWNAVFSQYRDVDTAFAASRWARTDRASPPPIAAPSGEADYLNSIARKLRTYVSIYTGDKEAKKMVDWCEHMAANPSPIASEPKDAGRGEGQDIAEQAAQFLWSLLDDIDTLSDHVKTDNVTYREIAERIQRRRFEVGDTDGYTVTFKRKAEIRTAPSGAKP